MNTTLLREVFQRVRNLALSPVQDVEERYQCEACIDRALNLLVEETDPRIRLLPNYRARLRGPIIDAFMFINDLVDVIPGAMLCSRSSFVSDPRANAFFSGPEQICEIFSSSREVRELFDSSPLASECWGLLCMRKTETSRMGVAMEGGELRREVLQTYVEFSDHQVVSPGHTEEEARQALKCCIFRSLVAFIRREIISAKKALLDQGTRRRVLNGRLRTASDESRQAQLEGELRQLEAESAQGPALKTLNDYFEFITETLRDPKAYVSCRNFDIHMNRMGVQLDDASSEGGLLVPVTEILVTSHLPRIAALARFQRDELLPDRDFIREASLFLAL